MLTSGSSPKYHASNSRKSCPFAAKADHALKVVEEMFEDYSSVPRKG